MTEHERHPTIEQEIEKVDKWEWNLDCGGMEENPNGDYVLLYDYEILLEELIELREKLAAAEAK